MSSAVSSDETKAAGAPATMGGFSELKALIRGPTDFLTARLADPPSPRTLFLGRVALLAAIRPVAVLLRSVVGGTPLPGVVVGLGSFALLIGTWLGLALVLPALARQFHTELSERQAFALTTYASMPFWIAGVLFAFPEEPAFVFFWSRLVVLLVAVFGFFLVRQGIVALGVRRSMRMPLLGGITVAALLIHGLLFLLLGVSSLVVLYVVG